MAVSLDVKLNGNKTKLMSKGMEIKNVHIVEFKSQDFPVPPSASPPDVRPGHKGRWDIKGAQAMIATQLT